MQSDKLALTGVPVKLRVLADEIDKSLADATERRRAEWREKQKRYRAEKDKDN